MKVKQVLLGVSVVLLFCTGLWAQAVTSSQVSGVVQDQTGAVIADAQIQITRTDTDLTRTTTSDANGYYLLPNLPVGPYRLQVSKEGFNTYVQNGIVLEVSTNPSINPTLTVGAQTQQVVVEASAAMVETQSNGVGQVVDNQRVVELPLNGRQLTSLIFLAGAANTAPNGDLNTNKNYPTVSISVNGGLPNGVSYLLDGSTHNDPFNNLNLPLPFPDATQEFKVETSSLPAQYGDHAAAAVNVVTKSGTNAFHGDAFEFVRNYLFNAREADQPRRDSIKRNQFGGVIGGPIKKDKLFFFAGYQQTVLKSNPTSSATTVPTTAMRAGDFSAIVNPANGCAGFSGVTLRAPFGTGGAAPNTLPASAINQQGLNVFNKLPVPASSTDPCGLISVPIGANQSEQLGVGRIDYQFSSKHTFYGRYLVGNSLLPVTSDGKNILELNKVVQSNRAHTVALGDTFTYSPTFINSAHITVLRTRNVRGIVPWFDPESLGVHDTSDGSANLVPGFMGISVSNGFSLGQGANNKGYFNSTVWQFADDVDIIRGSHQITLGVDYIYALMNTVNGRLVNGSFGFTTSTNPTSSVTGLGYGDLLTGNVDGTFQQGNLDFENDGDNYVGFYAQDSWKANRRLTVNYGLRWEPYFPYHNLNHHAQLFNLANFINHVGSNVYSNSPAGLIYPGDSGFPGDSYQTGKMDDIAPRLGIVWDPKGDGKMTIRAGYGMFYDSPQMFFDTRYSNNPPWGASVSLAGPVSFTNPWATYPGDPNTPAGNSPFPALYKVSNNMQFPAEGIYVNSPLRSQPMYLEQWNFSIQKQVRAWLFSATYLGNETKHLPTAYEADPGFNIAGNCTANGFFPAPFGNVPDGLKANGACTQSGNLNNRRLLFLTSPPPTTGLPNPTQNPGSFYSTVGTLDSGGNANYNGMLLSAQHRLTHNFSILGNWTYSHCLSESETTELTGPSYVIPGYRHLSYSNCDSDVRHVVNISFIANTPKFSNRLVNAVAGGWQFSTIVTTKTGTFGTVSANGDIALSGIGGQIAQQVSNNFYVANKGSFTSKSFCNTTGTQVTGPGGIVEAPFTCNFQVNDLNSAAWANPVAGSSGVCTGALPTVTVNGGVYACSRPLTVENPGSLQVDTSLVRSFRISERQSVQFRWEAFNLPNHVNLGNPSTALSAVSGGTFGLITSAGSPRIMQFALKYVF
jgi:hypothetical protein